MQIPDDISGEAYDYMFVVLLGTGATVFYNMISNMLRALGDSKTPLYFLVFSSVFEYFSGYPVYCTVPYGCCGSCMGYDPFTVSLCPVQSDRQAEKLSGTASAP